MTKTVSTSKKPRKQYSPEFRSEALKLAERIGVAARELSLYGSQLYAWCSKLQQQMTSSERESELAADKNARLKRQLAEQAEELAILQKAATYFVKRLK
ncbi:transposase insE for insertion sequence IS3 [Escherichia coli KTE48]|nr:transposase insE for insertion sequence IS3 [Escherichia coli KTE48]